MSNDGNAEIVVMPGEAPPMGTTPEALKQMGVDLTVNKQDILNVVAQVLEDQATDLCKEAQDAQQAHLDAMRQKRLAHYQKHLKSIAKKKRVKDLVVALGIHYSAPYTVRLVKDNYNGYYVKVCPASTEEKPEATTFIHPVMFIPSGYRWDTTTPDRKTAKRAPREGGPVEFALDYKVAPFGMDAADLEEKKRLDEVLTKANEDLRLLPDNTKRAHTRVIRDLLAQTAHGSSLLGMLDSRTSTAKIRGMLASDEERAEARRARAGEVRAAGGVKHFYPGAGGFACGAKYNINKKFSAVKAEVTCKGCLKSKKYNKAT